MKTPKNSQSKQSMHRPRIFKDWLAILLVIAAILIIPLFFTIRSQAGQPVNPRPTAVSSDKSGAGYLFILFSFLLEQLLNV